MLATTHRFRRWLNISTEKKITVCMRNEITTNTTTATIIKVKKLRKKKQRKWTREEKENTKLKDRQHRQMFLISPNERKAIAKCIQLEWFTKSCKRKIKSFGGCCGCCCIVFQMSSFLRSTSLNLPVKPFECPHFTSNNTLKIFLTSFFFIHVPPQQQQQQKFFSFIFVSYSLPI